MCFSQLFALFLYPISTCYFGGMTLMQPLFQVENRYHSAGRARRFFHSVTRDDSSVVPRLFAIVAEQQRKQLVDAAQR